MTTTYTKINDEYYLGHDEFQWWFAKEKPRKDGNFEGARISGYFRELSGAFEDLGKREARSVEAESVPELIEALKHHETVMRELAEEIMEALKE